MIYFKKGVICMLKNLKGLLLIINIIFLIINVLNVFFINTKAEENINL